MRVRVLVLAAIAAAAHEAAAFGPRIHRTELHIHLDGSITTETLFAVAVARNMSLPPDGRVPEAADDIRALLVSGPSPSTSPP